MKSGDLVQVYAKPTRLVQGVHGKKGLTLTGIYLGWDFSDEGWIIFTEGSAEVFAKTFWNCRKVGESRWARLKLMEE